MERHVVLKYEIRLALIKMNRKESVGRNVIETLSGLDDFRINV